METITGKQVMKYFLLPGIIPRFRALAGSGFANLAYFMALVYRAVNILPENHKFLQHHALGTYGIIDVFTEAANHVKFTRHNIDQIIIFFALIAGLVILFIQFFLLLIALFINPAFAAEMPSNIGEFFVTQNPDNDIAFRLMDRVFGVPDLFGSQEATGTAFHQALHGLFQFYSVALLVIAILILIYFIIAVLAETAETGTPFGKRFNHVWAPIRLVVALGLLIPIGYGLNSAQWITLYAAKWGSGFATNGWTVFNDTLTGTYLGDADKLIAIPEPPDLSYLGAYMSVVRTCKYGVEMSKNSVGLGGIDAYLVKGTDGGSARPLASNSYDEALEFFDNGDIYIRFGEQNPTHTDRRGSVYPYCGDIVMHTNNISKGGKILQAAYYEMLKELWEGTTSGLDANAKRFAECTYIQGNGCDANFAEAGFKEDIYDAMMEKLKGDDGAIAEAVEAQEEELTDRSEYDDYGWGGAGIWYNQISQLNGDIVSALQNTPVIKTHPSMMETTREEQMAQDANVSFKEFFKSNLQDGRQVRYIDISDPRVANLLFRVHEYWYDDGELRVDSLSSHTAITGNAFIDAINAVLGTNGLFDMCRNTDIHPLAQLSNVGKGMVESAIYSLGTSFGLSVGSIAISEIQGVASAASSFFMTVASVSILIGFILFYILPLLPFLYFFFAVGGWIKGIFEAMVGVPLWALAHLRIDGQGLPGDAAQAGYFLIFEIFLRPILIIFGLLASVAIFSALVKILNEIFYLAVSNLSGFNPESVSVCGNSSGGSTPPAGSPEWFRGPVDEFFFTIVYAIIVYMIGMASFKLIDLIPNNILRWLGNSLTTFNDDRAGGEDAGGLVQKMAVGGSVTSGQLTSAAGQVGQGLTAAKQGVEKEFKQEDTPPEQNG